MASIFTKIINGEIPCYKVAETETLIAFLDINPLRAGHTLIVPKEEIDYIFDVDDELYIEMFAFAKQVARAIDMTIECNRVGVSVIGLEVPHAHIHLVPIDSLADLDFTKARVKLSAEEFATIAADLHTAYQSFG